jgi:hypothetical protein
MLNIWAYNPTSCARGRARASERQRRIAQKDLRAMCAFVQYREELPPISQREVVEKLTRTSSRDRTAAVRLLRRD